MTNKKYNSNYPILAIDASRSIDSIQKTGVELVSDEILKTISKEQSMDNIPGLGHPKTGIALRFYTPKPIPWLPQKQQKIIKTPRQRLWTILGLSLEMLKNKPDMLLIPVHGIPFFTPQKTFCIIHDIEFKLSPQSYSLREKIYLNFILKRAAHKCHRIFTMTNKVKADILRFTKLPAHKIIVIPHGYTPKNTHPAGSQPGLKQILYIGRIEAKKNLINLIQAFNLFNLQHPEFKLILIGKPGVGFKQIKQRAQTNQDNIILTGYISENKKQELLSTSSILVHISAHEGFCFPMLEAFDFNLPVLVADTKVLREVGADACLYTDHQNIQQISDSLKQIIFDDKLRQNLIQKGQHRLKHFSWPQTVKQILSIVMT